MGDDSYAGEYIPAPTEPPLQAFQVAAFAQSTSVAERRSAAMADALSADDAALLMFDDDRLVRSFALGNHAARRDDVERALERFPEHEDQVAEQENAPLYLMRRWPLRRATNLDSTQVAFLTLAGTSDAHRLRFQDRAAQLEASDHLDEYTLGSIWDETLADCSSPDTHPERSE